MGSPGKNGVEEEKTEMQGKKERSHNIGIIFRYADWVDVLLMVLGTIGAIGDGMSTNCLLVFASRLMNSLGNGQTQQNHGDFMTEVEKCSLYFVYLGLAVLLVAFMGLAFSTYFSWRLSLVAFPTLLLLIIPGIIYGKYLLYLSKKAYKEYGKANTIVEQALSSIKTVYSFTAECRIIERYSAVLDGITRLGIKQGIAKGLAIGSTGLSFAIWAFLAWYGSRLVMYKGESGGRIYAAGISFVLGGLSLGMALPDVKYFTEATAQEEPRKEVRKKSWLAGIGMGSAQCLTFVSWALDFWFGGTLVQKGEISAGDVFKTFFILVSTGRVIAEAGSMTSDLAKGSTAVASVFEIIDRQSLIPGSSQAGDGTSNGRKLEKITGRIEIRKVDFSYPSRPDTVVLRQFSLEVKPGTSIGLVGKSGCGKSTVIGLIQRFYDAESGSVRVDGVDIRELDIQWYRKHTALVSQEPVIYSGCIRDNIVFGKFDASENEVVEAARAANAHEFISALKDGYETECGERGVQLSGGQKQRIAIARAIIRNPIILLLDEATSALDLQSEQVVQEALDRIMVGRTTVVVAHRLNTIKKLDSIAFVADGKVVERGTYAQLKNRQGAFSKLASLQTT
ncbi:hypothetical protein SLEP1_g18559 [Rubroshorea leprosula]|uniref:Uncharacterized protein n=1 Tax=Rubroshorea leprosula TaxID=152421 RepID=A0AAV5J6U7_9ROSI|nr:hypothetical protein SLEP1_g18559 [Rubroshorea leprosula]